MYLKKNGKRKYVSSPEIAEACIKLGWQKIEKVGGCGSQTETSPRFDLEKLKKDELLALINERALTVPMGAKRADLIKTLENDESDIYGET